MKKLIILMACFVETIGIYAFDLTTQQLGVPSDGITLCSTQLQQAIDSISENGGGRLTLTRGTYLSGGLMLRSGVELHLEDGAILLGSTNPYDYSLLQKGAVDDGRADNASMALLMADHAEHIAITGKGIIDGQGLQLALNADSLHHKGIRIDQRYNTRRQRTSELSRPKLLFLYGCTDVIKTHFALKQSDYN